MGKYWIAAVFFTMNIAPIYADTFIHNQSGKTYEGYASRANEQGNATLSTNGTTIPINISDYTIEKDSKGRNQFISVIPIATSISTEIMTGAFEKTILEEAEKGPLFILIELDTPGGRVDYAQRICNAILDTKNCSTVAYINGKKEGGAYSAGAAIALSCDKIYMAPNASIGPATLVTSIRGRTVDLEKVVGENMSEKARSAWRNYLAALAQNNNRPAVMARAMEDKDISILEIQRDKKILFIDSQDRRPTDKLIQTRCKSGSLLTLTAQDALQCGISDGMANTRIELIRQLKAEKGRIEETENLTKALDELEIVQKKLDKLSERLDLHFKELSAKAKRGSLRRNDALKNYQKIIKEIKYIQKLARDYPDVEIDKDALQEFLNAVKADYESIRAMR